MGFDRAVEVSRQVPSWAGKDQARTSCNIHTYSKGTGEAGGFVIWRWGGKGGFEVEAGR